jgi:hypothetical protein
VNERPFGAFVVVLLAMLLGCLLPVEDASKRANIAREALDHHDSIIRARCVDQAATVADASLEALRARCKRPVAAHDALREQHKQVLHAAHEHAAGRIDDAALERELSKLDALRLELAAASSELVQLPELPQRAPSAPSPPPSSTSPPANASKTSEAP